MLFTVRNFSVVTVVFFFVVRAAAAAYNKEGENDRHKDCCEFLHLKSPKKKLVKKTLKNHVVKKPSKILKPKTFLSSKKNEPYP